MKEEIIALSRQVAESLLPVLKSRQGLEPSLEEVETFVQRVRDVMSDPLCRSIVCEEIMRVIATRWPSYVSEPEPWAETEYSRKLFPRAHAGNVRRLVDFVYASAYGQALAPSTRAYVMLNVLMLKHLSPWSVRSYKTFTNYLRRELSVTDTFNIRFVHPYWRHLPLAGWGWAKARKDAPRNAGEVMGFASFVRRCICLGCTEPDERLWRAHELGGPRCGA